MGKTTVDVLAHPVTSVRCSADGNALLATTLDSYIRLLDRTDGQLLAAFGGPSKKDEPLVQAIFNKPRHTYRNTELRVRSVFAQGDAVVLSGSEAAPKGDGVASGAAVFAWDILTGKNVATVPMGEDVKAVSCVAWNDKGYWAAGCADSKWRFSLIYCLDEFHGCWTLALTIVFLRYGEGLWLSQRLILPAERGCPRLHSTFFLEK
jgi:mitogen-activated protein kinase organizer 1